MSREDPQLKIRLPLELKEKITQSATDHGRSINSEVVARLEESFDVYEKTFDVYQKTMISQAQLIESQRLLEESIKQMRESLEQSRLLQARLMEKNESLYQELKELKTKKSS